jgi:hypothetical protein
MNRPTKNDVVERLRWFTGEVRKCRDSATRAHAPAAVIEVLDAVGARATYLSERLLVTTGRDYVAPDMANQLFALSRSLEATIPSVEDRLCSASLSAAAQAMRAFVSKYEPKQADSGKFVFPTEGDEP